MAMRREGMGQFRKSEDPNQGFLFPPSPSDWLPEGHLVWFIMETIEGLDIDRLLDKYRVSGKGELAYPPRVMLSLLVYGYCTGTFASRKIAVQMEENVAFRVIARGHQPTFRTICRFREENHEEFQQLFVQVVQLAQEAGLVKMGTIAIDGSKVKANASKHKAMSYDRMLMEEKRLRSEIAKLTRAAKNQDEVDDKAFGPDFRGDELPEELRTRKSRLATIEAAKKRLEARKAAEAEAKREAEKKDDDSDNKPGAGSRQPDHADVGQVLRAGLQRAGRGGREQADRRRCQRDPVDERPQPTAASTQRFLREHGQGTASRARRRGLQERERLRGAGCDEDQRFRCGWPRGQAVAATEEGTTVDRSDAREAQDEARSRAVSKEERHRRARLRMGETSARLPSLQHAGAAQGRGRVEPRLLGAQSPPDGDDGNETVSGNRVGKLSAAPTASISRYWDPSRSRTSLGGEVAK
jgi:transposase